MAKKRRKNRNIFSSIGKSIRFSLKVFFKVLPFAMVAAVIVVIFLGIRQTLYADNGLTIQKIRVEPAEALSANQNSLIQTTLYGKNIIRTDLRAISGRLEKDPSIENIVMTKRFPSEIHVQVIKRVPVAYIQFVPRGRMGLISSDGMVLEVVEPVRAQGVVLEAYGSGILNPLLGVFVRKSGVLEALKFFQVYQKEPMAAREPITKIRVDPLGNVNVLLREGPEVRLGRRPLQRMDAIKKINPLLESAMRKKIDYLDLQFDDVVVKQKL